MKNTAQQVLATAVTKILKGLIRVLLRHGVACGNIEELVRQAYVDVTFSLAAENGHKATISSVSAQTGLSRKEVKRLVELENQPAFSNGEKYNRAVRVISGWQNDSNYTSKENTPRPLSMRPDDAFSFHSLVKDYSGDITTKAMLDLLTASGCINQKDDTLHLIKHAYVPANDSEEIIKILGNDTSELISTINHNLLCDQSEKHYQRKVSNAYLNKETCEKFRKYASVRAQSYLEELDTWLSNNESHSSDDRQYVSVGVYYYHQPQSKEEQL